MTDDTKTFAEHLREWKDRTGVTNPQAATMFLVSEPTWKRYLSGKTVPHPWLQGLIIRVALDYEAAVKEAA